MAFLYRVKHCIKNFDMYPTRVNLTYKGKSEFKTLYGGTVSMAIKLIILVYAIGQILLVFTRGNSIKNTNKIVKDLTYDTTKHYIGKNTFAFAIGVIGPNPELMFDPTYFNFTLSQSQELKTNSINGEVISITPIAMEKCGDDFPFVTNKDVYDRIGLKDYYCPSNTDYYLSGNYNSNAFNTISISIIA